MDSSACAVLAEQLTGHLLAQIVNRGARGGPLFPQHYNTARRTPHRHRIRRKQILGGLAHEYQIAA
jgi:hypothetical protein